MRGSFFTEHSTIPTTAPILVTVEAALAELDKLDEIQLLFESVYPDAQVTHLLASLEFQVLQLLALHAFT